MNDETVREQLSSLMDGELPPDSARFLSKRLGNDPELAATWERWHCLRDSLRQQGTLAPVDLCARVRDALAEESTAPSAAPRSGALWRGLAGGAIAASVAAFALLFGQAALVPDAATPPAEATLAHVAPVTTTDLTPNWRLSPVADRESYLLAPPQVGSEFDGYFVEHGLASGSAGALGIVSYVPVVAMPATREGGDEARPGSSPR